MAERPCWIAECATACKRWVLPRPTAEWTYSGQKAGARQALLSATRCAAEKANWFDRPTWKVEKVSRRSSGEPARASPIDGADEVRAGRRRTEGVERSSSREDSKGGLARGGGALGARLTDGSKCIE